jgi:hypothetical protein
MVQVSLTQPGKLQQQGMMSSVTNIIIFYPSETV